MKLALSVFIFLFTFNINAATVTEFTEERFNALKAANASFVVDVFATWCPTCKKQSKVMQRYFDENPSSELTILKVNYDDQKPWVRYFKAPRQSTLVFYKGPKEVGRSIAQTDKGTLFGLMSKIDQ